MTAEQQFIFDLMAWRERARLAQDLIIGCGPVDLQCEFHGLKEKAYRSVTGLLTKLEERLQEIKEGELPF